MSKQLINNPATCVDDFLTGLVDAHSGLVRLPGHRVIFRKDLRNVKDKVALISGGGAGHEPAHAGFVGKGMLTGAISGAVFTSPPPSSIFAAIKTAIKFQPSAVLLIVTNYTGDRLNFGLAREWALNEEIKIEMIVVGEDCALTSADRSAGRRGLAGTILVHKIAGALAEQGASIDKILHVLTDVTTNLGTIGVCLHPCVIPGASRASFELGDTEIELGLGIHGEAGVRREAMGSCTQIVEMMIKHMTDCYSTTALQLKAKHEVVLLVNNLGGTSNLEMGVVTKEAMHYLKNTGVIVKRVYWGKFMTSLQMAGVSITILNLSGMEPSYSVLSLLDMDAVVSTPLLPLSVPSDDSAADVFELEHTLLQPAVASGPSLTPEDASLMKNCIRQICLSLMESEGRLNEYDRGVGDGDCGSTHARGATAIHSAFGIDADCSRPAVIFQTIGRICSEDMGGTSGAMYSIFMSAASRHLSACKIFSAKVFAEAFITGVQSVQQYGGALEGDRTMIDVLQPVANELIAMQDQPRQEIATHLAVAAEKAAKNTTSMRARAGRASYVSSSELRYPDPGATAVAVMISACGQVLSS